MAVASIDYAQLAHRVVKDALATTSGQNDYLLKLHGLLGRSYHRNTLTGWLKPPGEGGTVPSGDVVLASAALARMSLDARLYGQSLIGRLSEVERRLGIDPATDS